MLLPRTRLQPDTAHRFRVDGAEATHVRLDIFPDGGVARLRLFGSVTAEGLADLQPPLAGNRLTRASVAGGQNTGSGTAARAGRVSP